MHNCPGLLQNAVTRVLLAKLLPPFHVYVFTAVDSSVAARAFRLGSACCWLAAPIVICAHWESTISATRPVVDDAYGTRAEDLYSRLHWRCDSYDATCSHSNMSRPIMPVHSRPNGNRTGKLRVGLRVSL